MGAVYHAYQRSLDRSVAIKVLLPPSGDAPDWSDRFRREAQAMARLKHPGIVTVFDYGQGGELAWLVLEHVEGTDLRTLIEEGNLTPAEALGLVRPICDALQFAHDRGVVHRDIKPENVLLDVEGNVKLVDFGLAKLTDASSEHRLTRSGQAMGTPRYMAPEQLERPLEVDHRADIFSLGVVLYELLTGQVPAGVIEPPSAKISIDVRLDEVVLRTLQREPSRRYQSAQALGRDLERDPSPSPELDQKDPVAVARQRGLMSSRPQPRPGFTTADTLALVVLPASLVALHLYSHQPTGDAP